MALIWDPLLSGMIQDLKITPITWGDDNESKEKIWFTRVTVEEREQGRKLRTIFNARDIGEAFGWNILVCTDCSLSYFSRECWKEKPPALRTNNVVGQYFHHHHRQCCHQIISARRNAVVALEWCVVLCRGGGDLISQSGSRCTQQCKYCTMHNLYSSATCYYMYTHCNTLLTVIHRKYVFCSAILSSLFEELSQSYESKIYFKVCIWKKFIAQKWIIYCTAVLSSVVTESWLGRTRAGRPSDWESSPRLVW